MRQRFGLHAKYVLWILIVVFVVGIFYVFGLGGGGSNRGQRGDEGGGGKELPPVVATADGHKILRGEVDAQFLSIKETYSQIGYYSLAMGELVRATAFRQVVGTTLQLADARRRGIRASRSEVSAEIDKMVEEQIAAVKKQYGEEKFGEVVAAIMLQQTQQRNATEKDLRKWLTGQYRGNRDAVAREIVLRKLQEQVRGEVATTEKDLIESYDQVQARHILLLSAPSDDPKEQAKNDAAARKKAEDALAKLKAGADFATLAKQISEDPRSKAKGGDRGFFPRGTMVPEFDQEAFRLKPGEMSGLVKTSYGYHIIKVGARRSQLPANFEKDKATLLKDLQTQRQGQAWSKYQADLVDKAKIDVRDPEIRGARALAAGNVEAALAAFRQAEAGIARAGGESSGEVRAVFFFQLGDLYKGKREWKAAAAAFEQCLGTRSGNTGETYIALGDVYAQQGDKEGAITQYQAAAEVSPDERLVHDSLDAAYKRLGRNDLAATEQERWRKSQAQASPGMTPAE
jgi:parvulin-like peptidyl-prolyl isomerase